MAHVHLRLIVLYFMTRFRLSSKMEFYIKVEASQIAGRKKLLFYKIRVHNTIYLTFIVIIGLWLLSGCLTILLSSASSLVISVQLFDWTIYVYTMPSILL